jgi:hypothetical protein
VDCPHPPLPYSSAIVGSGPVGSLGRLVRSGTDVWSLPFSFVVAA